MLRRPAGAPAPAEPVAVLPDGAPPGSPFVGEPYAERALSGYERTLDGLDTFGRHVPIALLVLGYIWHFSTLAIAVYDGYGMPPFDLAVFDQGVWLLSRFDDPFVTIMGRNLFGDHTSFILLLVVPIYWVWPHVQALLVLQTVIIAAGAVPIYLLVRRLTDSCLIAFAIGAAYLLNPALENGNLEQFHPECFLTLAIATGIYAAVTWRPALLVAMVVVCLLVKEDTALLVAPLGLWVLWRRDRRVGGAIVAASLAYLVVCVEVIQPLLLGAPYLYSGRIPFGGPWGAVKTLFSHPDQVWGYLWSQDRPWYLWQMLGAVGFGFVWAPEIAAIAVLMLVENLISNFPYMHQILYHYSLSSVPVLVLGAGYAVSRLKGRLKQYAASAVVLGSAVAACTMWGLMPFSLPSYPHWSAGSPPVLGINKLVDALPGDAVVSAWWPIVAHIDHRSKVYVWPNPFEASNYGSNPAADNGPLPAVGQDRYLIMPSPVTGQPDAAIFSSIRSQFRATLSAGGFTLYRRVAPPAPPAGHLP